MNNWLTHVLILIGISGTIFFTSLGKARLWDRDEPRNAGCAVEMMQQEQYIVPVFNDELRHQKPVLLYWLMVAAYQVFGVSEFAARFWSALLGCGTILLTYAIGRRLLGATVAWFAGIATASSLMFVVAARAATPDSALIFFTTLGIYFYVIGTFAADQRSGLLLRTPGHWFPQNWLYVVAMNLAFALAVLTKGPVGIVLPTAIIGMFLLIQRLPTQDSVSGSRSKVVANNMLRLVNPIHFFRTCWYMRPLTALVCTALVAAPWFIAVGIQTEGSFTNLFFLNENFNRATSVMENHSGGWWFYPVAVAIGFFPWSVLLGPVVVACFQTIHRDLDRRPVILFLVCWVMVQIGLFSLAETKLPSYVTPCYPALALLTAYCLVDWLPRAGRSEKLWQLGAGATLILGGMITSAALAYATGKFLSGIAWIAAIGLIPVAGGCFAIWFARERPKFVPGTMAVTAVVFCLLFFGVGTVAVDSVRDTEVVLNDIRQSRPERKVASFYCLESSWVFYCGRPIYELQRGVDHSNTVQTLARDRWWHRKPEVSPEDFVHQNPDAWLVTTDEHVDELLARLPKGYAVVKDADFFLKADRQLLLIENTSRSTARPGSTNAMR